MDRAEAVARVSDTAAGMHATASAFRAGGPPPRLSDFRRSSFVVRLDRELRVLGRLTVERGVAS